MSWSAKTTWFYVALVFLFGSTAVGQVIRLSLLSGDRVTLTAADMVLIVVGLGLMIDFFVRARWRAAFRYVWSVPTWRYLMLFVGWALVSLVLNFHQYTHGELLTGFSYWGRLALTVFITLASAFLFNAQDGRRVLGYTIIFGLTAVLLGFVQLILLPNFTVFAAQGWDPHIGRLLSTFYDPNYFGAYLGLVMGLTLGTALYRPTTRFWKGFLCVAFLLAWVALYLTYSRSGWLISFLIVPLVAWKKSWKWSALLALVFVVVILLPNRLSSRIDQADSYLNTSTVQNGGDPSAAARAVGSKLALRLARTEIVTGVGYNVYGYAMVHKGLFTAHQLAARSGMGADNSFLQVLATTGLVGLILYLLFYGSMLWTLWKHRARWEAWTFLLIGIAFTVGCFFNNILFYLPIIVTWWLGLAWVVKAGDGAV